MDDSSQLASPSGFPIVLDEELRRSLVRLRETERLLHRFEGRLSGSAEEGEIGTAHIDLEGRFLSVSDGLCAMVGYPEGELIGERVDDFVHPGDLGTTGDQLRKILAGEVDGCVLEQRFIRRDGEVVVFRLSVSLLRCIRGLPMYLVAVVSDLTREDQLRRLHAQARAEFDRQSGLLDARLAAVSAGITVIDALTGTILYSNPQAVQTLGLPRRSAGQRIGYPMILEAMEARRADGTIYPADGEPLASAIVAGELVLGESLRCRSRTGESIELVFSSAPIRDDLGRVVLAVVVLQAHADREALNETIRRLEREAEAMKRQKSEFLALMSHGIRLPITSIEGYCELLLLGTSEPIGGQARDQVRRIKEAGRQLLNLIDDVLLFARIESGIETELATRPVDISAAIGELARLYDPVAERGRIELSTEVPDHQIVACTDDRRFKSVVAGLVSNGLQLAGEGSVCIRLDQQGGRLDLKIACAGPHITPEAVEKLSGPTWTTPFQVPTAEPGSVIGLAVVRPLASALGGSLEISSSRGAVDFVLQLPIGTDESGDG